MRILHLEDDLSDAETARRRMLKAWPDAEIVLCGDSSKLGLLLLRSADFDAVVSEAGPAGADCTRRLEIVRKLAPETPFILLSSRLGGDAALRALCAGVADCVFKDRIEMLAPAIARAVARRGEALRTRQLEALCSAQANMLHLAHDIVIVEEQGCRISFWNQAAEKALGWTAGEVSGRALKWLAAEEGAAEFDEAARLSIERGGWSGVLTLKARDGRLVPIEVRRSVVKGTDGRPAAHLTVGTDLTEKRRLEDLLHRSQRLECVSSLATGVAHDLNNILTPLIMALGMLRNEIRDPGQLRLMDTLGKGAGRAAGLVRQMLSFTHGSTAPLRSLCPAEVIREVGSLVRASFPAGLSLEEETPDGLWPVRVQETHLHQILLNLAVNSRDAMPSGGKLKISARNVTLQEAEAGAIRHGRAGHFVMFSAADTGTGIKPEDRDRIWEPFYTTKSDGKGTGLGLPTIDGIAARYNGFMDMTSTPGCGSCFRIYLPATFDEAAIVGDGNAAGRERHPSAV